MNPVRLAAAALLAVLAAVTLGAAAASAHAELVETSPVDGEIWIVQPTEVLVAFDEPVTAPVGAIRVFDSRGERVDAGEVDLVDEGTAMVAPLPGDLEPGAYIVTWRAVSGDGHPVKGAFVFHFGEEGSPVEDSFVTSLLGASEDRPFAVAGAVARWLAYLAVLLSIGGFVFVSVVHPNRDDSRPVRRLVRIACLVGAAAALAQIPLSAAESTGLGVDAFTSAAALGDVVTSSIGVSALLQVTGFVLLYAAAGGLALLGWLGAALLLAGQVATGHTRTTEPSWLVLTADALHVGAAAVWTGGLAAMAITWRRRSGDPATLATVVARFSTVAAWSVLLLLIAGAALSWSQVGALRAATSTPYGRTLIAKVVIVVAVLLVALYNNRVLVPRIVGGGDDANRAGRRLGSTIRWELVGIVAAVGVTAFLVNMQPAAEAAGVSGAYSTFVPFGDGELNVVIDPNRAGDNEIHLYLLTAGGRPDDTAGAVTLELTFPAEDVGPIVRTPPKAGAGHYFIAGPELALPGTWEITVRQRITDFQEESAVVTVVVNE